MNKKLIITLSAALLAGCGDGAKPPEVQGRGLRQYDKNVLVRGERVFQTNCAVCHGSGGEGKPGWQQPGPDGLLLPPPLDNSGRAWRLSSDQMKQFIRQGSPHGRSNMPAWQGKLSGQEIDEVVIWITSQWSDAIYLEWLTKTEKKQN
jgi:mono/diheme cytochrome c family protein